MQRQVSVLKWALIWDCSFDQKFIPGSCVEYLPKWKYVTQTFITYKKKLSCFWYPLLNGYFWVRKIGHGIVWRFGILFLWSFDSEPTILIPINSYTLRCFFCEENLISFWHLGYWTMFRDSFKSRGSRNRWNMNLNGVLSFVSWCNLTFGWVKWSWSNFRFKLLLWFNFRLFERKFLTPFSIFDWLSDLEPVLVVIFSTNAFALALKFSRISILCSKVTLLLSLGVITGVSKESTFLTEARRLVFKAWIFLQSWKMMITLLWTFLEFL